MQGCGRSIRGVLAGLLVLAAFVGAPPARHADLTGFETPAPSVAAADTAACAESREADTMAADGSDCIRSLGTDRHCCADPHCLSVHGGLPPRIATVPDDSGIAVHHSILVDRLDGAEPAPGVRPPRPRA